MRYEDLDVWKRAARLSADIYKALHDLKDFGFKDQITRSGLSIASNIAEGYERESEKDRGKFLSYAKGSCAELRTQIYALKRTSSTARSGRSGSKETEELSKMLYSLMQYFRSSS